MNARPTKEFTCCLQGDMPPIIPVIRGSIAFLDDDGAIGNERRDGADGCKQGSDESAYGADRDGKFDG